MIVHERLPCEGFVQFGYQPWGLGFWVPGAWLLCCGAVLSMCAHRLCRHVFRKREQCMCAWRHCMRRVVVVVMVVVLWQDVQPSVWGFLTFLCRDSAPVTSSPPVASVCLPADHGCFAGVLWCLCVAAPVGCKRSSWVVQLIRPHSLTRLGCCCGLSCQCRGWLCKCPSGCCGYFEGRREGFDLRPQGRRRGEGKGVT
jgi:hypothetical protein